MQDLPYTTWGNISNWKAVYGPRHGSCKLCEVIMDLKHEFEVFKLLYMQEVMLVALGLLCTYDLRYLHSHIFNIKVDLCNKATDKLLWAGFSVLNRKEEPFILINNRLTEMWHDFALKFCQCEQCLLQNPKMREVGFLLFLLGELPLYQMWC